MDEKQALLVVLAALELARDYYNRLLKNKISYDLVYESECGYGYLMLALNNVSDRIKEIEYEQEVVQ